MGVPLSGKSSLGGKLSLRTGIRFIDIDGGPASYAPPQEPEPLSSPEKRERERKRMAIKYSVLHEAIAANLRAGYPLIVSATYASRSSQEFLRCAVEANGGTLKLILCMFEDSDEEVERRMQKRHANGETGGCRSISTYRADKAKYEGTDLPHLTVDTSGDIDQAVERVIDYLAQ